MNRVISIGFLIISSSLVSVQAVAAPPVTVLPRNEFSALHQVEYRWRAHGHRWNHVSRSNPGIRRHASGAAFQPTPVPRNLGAVGTTTTNSPLLNITANPQVAPSGPTTTGSGSASGTAPVTAQGRRDGGTTLISPLGRPLSSPPSSGTSSGSSNGGSMSGSSGAGGR